MSDFNAITTTSGIQHRDSSTVSRQQAVDANQQLRLLDDVKQALADAIGSANRSGFSHISLDTTIPTPREFPGSASATLNEVLEWASDSGLPLFNAGGILDQSKHEPSIAGASEWLAKLDNTKQAVEATLPTFAQKNGVEYAGGEWKLDGKAMSLSELNMAVRMKQINVIDNKLNFELSSLEIKNREISAITQFVSDLEDVLSDESVWADGALNWHETLSSTNEPLHRLLEGWESRNGYDPLTWLKAQGATYETFGQAADQGGTVGKFTREEIEEMAKLAKGQIETFNGDNAIAQLAIERLNNQRNEAFEGLSAFTRTANSTTSSVGRQI